MILVVTHKGPVSWHNLRVTVAIQATNHSFYLQYIDMHTYSGIKEFYMIAITWKFIKSSGLKASRSVVSQVLIVPCFSVRVIGKTRQDVRGWLVLFPHHKHWAK